MPNETSLSLDCELCGTKTRFKPESLDEAEKTWYLANYFVLCQICKETPNGKELIFDQEFFMDIYAIFHTNYEGRMLEHPPLEENRKSGQQMIGELNHK